MAPAPFIAAAFSRWRRRFFPSPELGESEAIRLGREGERLAARHLRRHGYKVLYRNFRAPHGGEVDLVCRDKACRTLAFVEVKTRRSLATGAPAEAVTPAKQQLIVRGALAWLAMLDRQDIVVRFNVVEVVLREGEPQIQIIKNAFQPSEQLRG